MQVSKSNLEKDRFTRNLEQLKDKVSTLENTEQIKNKLERETQHLSQELEKYTGIQVIQGDTWILVTQRDSGIQVTQGSWDTGSTREYRDIVKTERYWEYGYREYGFREYGFRKYGYRGIEPRVLQWNTESRN